MVTETMNEAGNIEKRAKRFKDFTSQEKWQIFLETNIMVGKNWTTF